MGNCAAVQEDYQERFQVDGNRKMGGGHKTNHSPLKFRYRIFWPETGGEKKRQGGGTWFVDKEEKKRSTKT